MGDEVDRLRAERDLYRRLLDLSEADRPGVLLREALELVQEVTGARLGYLALHHAEDEEPTWELSLGLDAAQLKSVRARLSTGILAEAMASGQTMHTDSAQLDERFRAQPSVRRNRIDAVLCSPIRHEAVGSGLRGALYLQGGPGGIFDEAAVADAERVARQIAPLAERLVLRRPPIDPTRTARERLVGCQLVGRTPSLAALLDEVARFAGYDVDLVIRGPTGSGKTEVARLVHRNSRRAQGAFVELNCAALPDSLVEAELFGAQAGAYTDARADRPGLLRRADGGTLFLDEVAELSPAAQGVLLRAVQERRFHPVGSTEEVEVDVRLLAATHVDLDAAVERGDFRADLLYRLRHAELRVPGLEERREDIPELSEHLVRSLARRHRIRPRRLSPAGRYALQVAPWPGHVRQLRAALERGLIRADAEDSPSILVRHLLPGEQRPSEPARSWHDATRAFQRELLRRALADNEGNVSATARQLELSRSRVYEVIDALGVRRE